MKTNEIKAKAIPANETDYFGLHIEKATDEDKMDAPKYGPEGHEWAVLGDKMIEWSGMGRYYGFVGRGTPSGGFRISADGRKLIRANYSSYDGIELNKDGFPVRVYVDIEDTFAFTPAFA